jgi:hypothetical protein
MTQLRIERFDSTHALIRREPFPFLIASEVLRAQDQETLERDFPRYTEPGFFPYQAEECGPSVRALIDELCSAPVADRLGAELGIEHLARYPTLVTICTALNRRHGNIHTDSRSKVATALLYFNRNWPETSAGCLRFLADEHSIDRTLAPELRPTFGNFAIFKRTDNSFHGHLPHEGERRVIQIAWVVDEAAKDRKARRGRFSRFIKHWFPALDRKFRSRQ